MRFRNPAGLALAAALAAGIAPAAAQFDRIEGTVHEHVGSDPIAPLVLPTEFPPVSADSALVAYEPDDARGRHYWIDRPSIVVEGPYVRATVVVASSSGVRNVSHVAFDCDGKKLALLATAAADGHWTPTGSIAWRAVTQDRRYTPYLTAVYRAVCDGGAPARSVAQMIERLETPHLRDDY